MRERDDQDFIIHTEAKETADFIDPYAVPDEEDSIEALKKLRRIENSDGHLVDELENYELVDCESESGAKINEKFAKANEEEALFQEELKSSQDKEYAISMETAIGLASHLGITVEQFLLNMNIDPSRVRPISKPFGHRLDKFIEGVDYESNDISKENLESLDKNRPNPSYSHEKKKEYWYNKD